MDLDKFCARPNWSIKNYWVWAKEDGYRGVGQMRWWRGGVTWVSTYRMRKDIERTLQSIAQTREQMELTKKLD